MPLPAKAAPCSLRRVRPPSRHAAKSRRAAYNLGADPQIHFRCQARSPARAPAATGRRGPVCSPIARNAASAAGPAGRVGKSRGPVRTPWEAPHRALSPCAHGAAAGAVRACTAPHKPGLPAPDPAHFCLSASPLPFPRGGPPPRASMHRCASRPCRLAEKGAGRGGSATNWAPASTPNRSLDAKPPWPAFVHMRPPCRTRVYGSANVLHLSYGMVRGGRSAAMI